MNTIIIAECQLCGKKVLYETSDKEFSNYLQSIVEKRLLNYIHYSKTYA